MVDALTAACTLFFIYSVFLFFQNTYKTNVIFSLVNAFFFAVLITYFLGLIGMLTWSFFVFLTVGIAILFKQRAGPKPILDFTPLLVPTVFLIVWINAVPGDFKFVNWDEFASWGPNIKALTLDNALYTNAGSNGEVGGGYKGYPPGQQLMQYLFTSSAGWSEQHVVWAQGIVLGILLILVIELEFRKFGLVKYLFFVPAVTLFYILGYSFTSIYADGLLGVFGLATYSITKEILNNHSMRVKYLLIAPYGVIVLIKPTGIVIGTLVLLICVIQSEIETLKHSTLYFRSTLRRVISKSFYPLISMLVAYILWEIYVEHHKIEKLTFAFSNPGNKLIERFLDLSAVFINQFNQGVSLFTLPGGRGDLRLDFIALVSCVLILQATFTFYYIKNQKIHQALSSLVPISVGLIYFGFVFTMYLFFIDEYERESGGSIRRYFASFMFIVVFLVLAEAAKLVYELKKLRSLFTIILIILQFLMPTAQMKSDFTHARPNLDLLAVRVAVENQVDTVSKLVSRNESVYYFNQGSTGYEKNVFVYLMMPNRVNWWCWSVGEPVFPGDIWTCDKNVLETLPKNQVFVLAHNDGQIKVNVENQISFEISDQELDEGVYKVVENSGDKIQIKLLAKF